MSSTVTDPTDTGFYGHPRGLSTLFFTEMWERYSYYGTRTLLEPFLVTSVAAGGLGFSKLNAGAIYGFYASMGYLFALPGGWFADRVVGQRKAALYGGFLIAAGNLCLVAPSMALFYTGLVMLIMGTGLLKPNVSTMVGHLYRPNDPRRDSGFSIYYMGINLGALLAPLIGSWVGEKVSWRLGFLTSAIGMSIGIIQYIAGGKRLGNVGLQPTSSGDPAKDRAQVRTAGVWAAAVIAGICLLVLLHSQGIITITVAGISTALGWFLIGATVAVFSWMIFGRGWSPEERKKSVAVFVFFAASAIFWATFEQAGSSLNLFAFEKTDRFVLGWEFPAGWFQFVQPIFVVLLAPVFAWLWLALGKREPSSPGKFAVALLFGGLAFGVMVPAAFSNHASLWWLVGCYFLQTLGELCLSPVGLSAMTKLAPARAGGIVMGIWFLGTSIGNWLAGRAGSLFDSIPLPQLFSVSAITALVTAVILALLIKPTVKLMSGVK